MAGVSEGQREKYQRDQTFLHNEGIKQTDTVKEKFGLTVGSFVQMARLSRAGEEQQ